MVRDRVAYSGALIVVFERSGIVVNARIWFVMKRDHHAESMVRQLRYWGVMDRPQRYVEFMK